MRKPQKQESIDNAETLGEHIRNKRIAAKQTQLTAANCIGVDEASIFGWENGRNVPQVRHYPSIMEYLRYYPFTHEIDSIAGKLLQVRYCNGWSCKCFAEILYIDTATIRRWELKKVPVDKRKHVAIISLWHKIPEHFRQRYRL